MFSRCWISLYQAWWWQVRKRL